MKKTIGLAVALILSLSAQAQQWTPLEPPIEVTPLWETNEMIVHFNKGVRPTQIEVNDQSFRLTCWERVRRRKKIQLPTTNKDSVSILVAWETDGVRRTYRVLLFK